MTPDSLRDVLAEAERWLPVPGFPDYEVSNLGRIASTKPWRGHNGRRIRKAVPSREYLRVHLAKAEGGRAQLTVHELVLLAFEGPRPPGRIIRHLNGVGSDNRLSNLAYGTYSENALDKRAHGTSRRSETHCKRGHEFTPENTYWQAGGKFRRCRECKRLTNQVWHKTRVRRRRLAA
jgi:hypothetical protein